MRCGSMAEGDVGIGGSGTHGRVRDDTTVMGIIFHWDVEVNADEDAFALDGIGEGGVVDEELVCEGHGRDEEEVDGKDRV